MFKQLSSVGLLVCICLVLFSSCKDDPNDLQLNHDGANFNSPELPAATYESAAMFPSAFDGNDAGNELYAIEYYIDQIPASAEINVYRGGTNEPDSLVFSAPVLTQITQDSWNVATVSPPIVLDGGNFWISMRYSQTGTQRTLGCDAGPAVSNGDWLYDSQDGSWIPLSDRSTININWNLRAKVAIPEE